MKLWDGNVFTSIITGSGGEYPWSLLRELDEVSTWGEYPGEWVVEGGYSPPLDMRLAREGWVLTPPPWHPVAATKICTIGKRRYGFYWNAFLFRMYSINNTVRQTVFLFKNWLHPFWARNRTTIITEQPTSKPLHRNQPEYSSLYINIITSHKVVLSMLHINTA